MKRTPIKLIALVAALLAVFAIFNVLTGIQRNQEAQTVQTAAVLVAGTEIASGTALTADMLTVKEMPVTDILPGALTAPEDAAGQITNQRILAGEQIVPEKLGGIWLSYRLKEGMRAMSLAVEIESGVAGLIRPGDTVDILYTAPVRVTEQNGLSLSAVTTEAVLENITVCAIDQVYNEDQALLRASDAVYSSVTLEVTPEQASRLAEIMSERDLNDGSIRLTLRSRMEEQ